MYIILFFSSSGHFEKNILVQKKTLEYPDFHSAAAWYIWLQLDYNLAHAW